MTSEIQLFLKDKKEELLLGYKDDAIKLIMKFFSSKNENIEDLEKFRYNQDMYKKLKWDKEKHFDVINSFWTVFSCAVIREVHDNKEYSRSKRFYNFPDYICHETPWIPGGKNGYKGEDGKWKDSFPERYLKLSGTRTIVNSTIKTFPELNELAAVTHSVANFMPCPPNHKEYNYNCMKGKAQRVHDFFPLMIDLIEQSCNNKDFSIKTHGVTVDEEIAQAWKDWFISKREIYCLEDYYDVDTDSKGMKHIKGIPFFKKQNLNYPLPLTEDEVTKCLDEMIRRIKERAYKLSNI